MNVSFIFFNWYFLDVLLSLVRTKSIGHLRDPRRLIVALSRARLGLYVFCRYKLFSNCFELGPVFKQMGKRPMDSLWLRGGERYFLKSSKASGIGPPFVVDLKRSFEDTGLESLSPTHFVSSKSKKVGESGKDQIQGSIMETRTFNSAQDEKIVWKVKAGYESLVYKMESVEHMGQYTQQMVKEVVLQLKASSNPSLEPTQLVTSIPIPSPSNSKTLTHQISGSQRPMDVDDDGDSLKDFSVQEIQDEVSVDSWIQVEVSGSQELLESQTSIDKVEALNSPKTTSIKEPQSKKSEGSKIVKGKPGNSVKTLISDVESPAREPEVELGKNDSESKVKKSKSITPKKKNNKAIIATQPRSSSRRKK